MRPNKIFILTLLSAACGSTQVTKTWEAPESETAAVRKVLVVATVSDEGSRRTLEERLTHELAKNGIAASASYRVLSESEKLSRDAVRTAAENEGYDAVLVTRYLGQEKELQYTSNFTYYDYIGGLMSTPGYYTEIAREKYDVKLFNTAKGTLLWAGTGETDETSNPEKSTERIAKAIADELEKDVAI